MERKRQITDEMFRQAAEESEALWLSRQLQELPEEAPAFSPDFEKRMQEVLFEAGKPAPKRKKPFFTRRIAACLVGVCSVTLCLMFSTETVRASVRSMMMTWFDDHTEFTFQEELDEDVTLSDYQLTYIPEGLEVKDRFSGLSKRVLYGNAEGDLWVDFSCYLADTGLTMSIDNEHSTYSTIRLRGVEAQLFTAISDEYASFLLWQEGNVFFSLIGNVDVEELLAMAEGIQEAP